LLRIERRRTGQREEKFMETMKAVRVHQYGGPEVLRYEEAPRPKPVRAKSSGMLRPIVEAVFPLNEARYAQELSQTGHARGKIVLKVA
jgi:NADPH:quinone reductase-like Zn-dependent oxidoreductase